MSSGRSQALASPSLVRWSRATSGLDVAGAAKRLKVPSATVEAWESGEKRPSMAQLRRMAAVYKRPLAVFYLSEPPVDFTPLRDFRTIAGHEQTIDTPRLAFEIRRAHQRREAALELADVNGDGPVLFRVRSRLTDEPTAVAGRLRELLAISLDEQFAWSNQYECLNAWKGAAERVGVLVFQTESLPLEEARGFSLAQFPLPVIALNTKDSPRGRAFTLMHELAHIALRAGGVCDLHEIAHSNREIDRMEVFCNRVAGETLIPRASIAPSLETLGLAHEREWLDPALHAFAARYSVSMDAALRSLVQAGRFPMAAYIERHAEFLELSRSARPKAGRVPYFRRALSWAGRRFAHMALIAYDDQRISSADLTEFLHVKMKQVDQIRAALRSDEHPGSA